MKKIYTTLFAFGTLLGAQAQNGHIVNGDFENWISTDLFDNANEWQTANQEYPGEALVTKSTDAMDGSFSAKLENKLIDGDTAFSYIYMGGEGGGDPMSNGFAYTDQIDSITGYWNFECQPTDSITVLVVQFAMGQPIPFIQTLSGSSNGWERFAFKLNLPLGTQDSMSVAFATGSPFEEYAVPGTWMQVDDVTFVGASGAATDIPNHSFEDWTTITNEECDYFHSYNLYTAPLGVATVEKTTDAYSGMYAMAIETKEVEMWQDTLQGVMANGAIDMIFGGPMGLLPAQTYFGQPTSLDGYYKYAGAMSDDSAQVMVTFYNGGSFLGGNNLWLGDAASYTPFSVALNIPSQPDSVTFVFMSGQEVGSRLVIDSIDFVGGNLSISENKMGLKDVSVYPVPASNEVTVEFELLFDSEVRYAIYDVTGKVVAQTRMNGSYPGAKRDVIDIAHLENGNYILQVETSKGNVAKHITKF